MRKKRKTPLSQDLNFEDFKWCIENDFQVYIKPLTTFFLNERGEKVYHGTGKFQIAVRRNGITTQGKDEAMINGRIYKSVETVGDAVFNDYNSAQEKINYVYSYLRKKYG